MRATKQNQPQNHAAASIAQNGEHREVLANGIIPEKNPAEMLARGNGQIVDDVSSPEQGPEPKRYVVSRVPNSGYVAHGGGNAFLRPGKVIDDTNYDVKQLRRAGVVLVAVPAGMGVDDALEKFQSGELK